MDLGPKVPLALLAGSRAVGPSYLSPEEQISRNKGTSELVIPLHTVPGQRQQYPRQGPRGGVVPVGALCLAVWLSWPQGLAALQHGLQQHRIQQAWG